jgi:site-specific recombinase XerC
MAANLVDSASRALSLCRKIDLRYVKANEVRDRCLLLLMFRHGLRVSEACRMKLDEVDTESRVLHVARLKGGLSTTQPLRGDELRAVSAWLKERARMKPTVKAFFVGCGARRTAGRRVRLHRPIGTPSKERMKIVARTFVNESKLRQKFSVELSRHFHAFHPQIDVIKATRFHFLILNRMA